MFIAVVGFKREQYVTLAKEFGVVRICYIEAEKVRETGFKFPFRGNIPLGGICVHSKLLRSNSDRLIVNKLIRMGQSMKPVVYTRQCPNFETLRECVDSHFHPKVEQRRPDFVAESPDMTHVMRPSNNPPKSSGALILVDKYAHQEIIDRRDEVNRLHQYFIRAFALKFSVLTIKKALDTCRPDNRTRRKTA